MVVKNVGANADGEFQRVNVYTNREKALEYIADGMPLSFAALKKILSEVQTRLPSLDPKSILDFGCGSSTALFAARAVWDNIKNYYGIDTSEHMIKYSLSLTADLTTETRFSNEIGKVEPRPLVIAAYSLSELSAKDFKKTLERLWKSCTDTIVIVEKGDEAGFKTVLSARDFILEKHPPSIENEDAAYVVAPCPHDKQCFFSKPTQFKATSFCHFSVRMLRTSLSGKSKHFHPWMKAEHQGDFDPETLASKGSQSADLMHHFSYVVLRKKPSPRLLDQAARRKELDGWIHPPIMDLFPQDLLKPDSFSSPSISVVEETGIKNKDLKPLVEVHRVAHRMPRIILPLMKRKSQVIADLCGPDGSWQHHNLSKGRVGKLGYRQARKSRWGDLWPFPLTKGTLRPPFYQLSKKELAKKANEEKVVTEETKNAEREKAIKIRGLEEKLGVFATETEVSVFDEVVNPEKPLKRTLQKVLGMGDDLKDASTKDFAVTKSIHEKSLDSVWDAVIENVSQSPVVNTSKSKSKRKPTK